MAEYSVPNSSPYYYGEDSTYKPRSVRKKTAPKSRAEFELDAQGLPVRVNPIASSQSAATNNTSVTPVTAEGASSPSYYEAVRQGPDGGRLPSAGNAGSGNGRDIPRGDASGTQTGPSQAKPADMAAFLATLQGKDWGIKFNFNEQDRNGYQSNALPGTSAAMGPVASADAYGAMLKGTEGTTGVGPYADANLYGSVLEGRTGGQTAVGAQAGTSDAADAGDQSRALRVPGSQRAQQIFNERHHYLNNPVPPEIDKGEGFSARARAFLDYDGDKGIMGAQRAAEAAQRTIKQNGMLFAVDAEGNTTRISAEGEKALKADGNLVASQQFLNDYKYVPAGPNETQNPDVMTPVMASTNEVNTNFGPVADTEQYGKMLDATRGMSGIGPLADGNAYGLFLDGREPLMRQ